MDSKKVIMQLHPLERTVLPAITNGITLKKLAEKTKKQKIEVMRALQWLENKKLIFTQKLEEKFIVIEKNGLHTMKQGMPEKIFLKQIEKSPKTIQQIQKSGGLEKAEINVCLGRLRKIDAIEMKQGKIFITPYGELFLKKESLEESLLKLINKKRLHVEELKPEQKFAFDELKKRKAYLSEKTVKELVVNITADGKKIQKSKDLQKELIDKVSPHMLNRGTWKGKEFRGYDVEINVPKISGGKRHFVNQSIEYAKQIWLDMGFQEMKGPMLQTSFWNFDALFTAQDHPVRELQDTFYIEKPGKGKLPGKRVVDSVKSMHEDGGKSGSTGWKYKWNPEDAKLNCLRTHTTVLSSQTIAKLKKEDLPAKFFALGRCFRNETVDWCHLAEFNQTEGIVIDPNANFRHLLGYLKQFFKKMGFPKARFRPAHFPYTEPSVEIDVFHPIRKEWIELGGAGLFRPEVVIPLLGEDIPVLAWGPGFDRIIMDYHKLKDIRDLYINNLKQIKETKLWLK